MRIRRACTWNTSAPAFDASGKAGIDKNNYLMCTFADLKCCHCGLSVSYNIGTGYFIREILKYLSEKTGLKRPQYAWVLAWRGQHGKDALRSISGGCHRRLRGYHGLLEASEAHPCVSWCVPIHPGGQNGIFRETPPVWRSPGRIQAMRALALLRATGSPARDVSEALSPVYGRLTEKELLTAGGRLFCCFTL